jgi:hypothetical protein
MHTSRVFIMSLELSLVFLRFLAKAKKHEGGEKANFFLVFEEIIRRTENFINA